ncbi:putative toxin-antitoxin system toxin component, PIN family [Leptospira sp. GIMC2001]|uniref:putative toxin-antitoxin system toxin component, PIN family n=1 Tax=Leptospira sp. GIMC2001 TaxID=1513297 RepID=UPI00234AC949|nr:putative toxin-antitoxin system toxin component, PIN family [Leptospira sp. GIMC2001]WCL50776.1 putative toxin-antitoxin system toxin component, PIN family [Leptospira sp. GIMC2001]
MRIVLDTNVFFQAIRNKNGASGYILQKIIEKKLEMMISIPVFMEYQDVLTREKSLKQLDIDKKSVTTILDFVSLLATPVEINYLMRPNLKDESDNMFVDLAFASRSKFLITSNIKDFRHNADLRFDSFKIFKPTDFVKFWRGSYE